MNRFIKALEKSGKTNPSKLPDHEMPSLEELQDWNKEQSK